jgi:hypothetical protein
MLDDSRDIQSKMTTHLGYSSADYELLYCSSSMHGIMTVEEAATDLRQKVARKTNTVTVVESADKQKAFGIYAEAAWLSELHEEVPVRVPPYAPPSASPRCALTRAPQVHIYSAVPTSGLRLPNMLLQDQLLKAVVLKDPHLPLLEHRFNHHMKQVALQLQASGFSVARNSIVAKPQPPTGGWSVTFGDLAAEQFVGRWIEALGSHLRFPCRLQVWQLKPGTVNRPAGPPMVPKVAVGNQVGTRTELHTLPG